MNYATNIALIDKKNNEVVNIIWGFIYDLQKFEDDDFYPVPYDDIKVGIGDFYINGKFQDSEGKIRKSINEELVEMREALKILGVQLE